MTDRIVVATDGTMASLAALRMAAALARREGSTVLVIAVLRPPWPVPTSADAMARSWGGPMDQERTATLIHLIREQVRSCDADPARWIVHTEVGLAAPAIVRYASEHDAALILLGLGPHTLSDQWLGSETALRVIQLSHVPVLAVHPEADSLPQRAVIALDFSEYSLRAAHAAAALVGGAGELHLAYVSQLPPQVYDWKTTIDSDSLARQRQEELAGELSAEGGPRVESCILKGDPAGELLALAERVQAELISAGSHGRGFLGRLLLGSVAARLVRGARCSVLIAPPARLPVELEGGDRQAEAAAEGSLAGPPG